MNDRAGYRNHLLALIALIAVTLLVYWPILNGQFFSVDDADYVKNNTYVRARLNPQTIRWAFTTLYAANWHPLTWLSLHLDSQWYRRNPNGDPDPHGYHVTNLVLHIANVLLLFEVLWGMTGFMARSLTVAALFAIHPLHVESVAWITERKDVLSTFFWMLTIASYYGYVRRPEAWRYLTVVVLFACGLMAKPMVVTLPFVLLLLDYWPLERVRRLNEAPSPPSSAGHLAQMTPSRLLMEKLPLLILSALSSYITLQAQQPAMEGLALVPRYRILNAFSSYLSYLLKSFWPLNLSPFYRHLGAELPLEYAVAAIVVLSLITIWVLWKWREPYLAVGWFWYLGTLVPVIGFLQVGGQAMADRYTYVPLIGIFVMLTWWICDHVSGSVVAQKVVAGAAVACFGGLALLAHQQVERWADPAELWKHALRFDEKNYKAHAFLGVEDERSGQFEDALRHYRAAIAVFPDHVHAHCNLGNLLFQLGHVDEGIQELRTALSIDRNGAQAQFQLGRMLESKGLAAEAEEHFREALRVAPNYPEAHNSLGLILMQRSDFRGAIEQFSAAIRANSQDPIYFHNLGVAQELNHEIGQSAAAYREAVQLEPGNSKYRFSLGYALYESGDDIEAAAQFNAGLQIDPHWPKDANEFARSVVTREGSTPVDRQQALMMAERICKATRNQQPEYLDTLAAGYASVDDFEQAKRIAQEAIRVAIQQKQPMLASQIEFRLQHYEKRKPFREPIEKP